MNAIKKQISEPLIERYLSLIPSIPSSLKPSNVNKDTKKNAHIANINIYELNVIIIPPIER